MTTATIRTSICLAALVLPGQARPADAASWRVSVLGRGVDTGETPVVVAAAPGIPPGDYRLTPKVGGGTPTPATVFVDAGKTYLAAVLGHVTGDVRENYILAPDPSPAGRVECVLDKGWMPKVGGSNDFPMGPVSIAVVVAGKPLTTYYRTFEGSPRPYYHPLIGPAGESVTRDYPMKIVAGESKDHPHHRSLWFTHGAVNGIDFWSDAPKHGTIREVGRPTIVSGAGFGMIRTEDTWAGPDGAAVCDDERVARFYDTHPNRVLDLDVTIKATHGPVTFGDTKEGTLGLRVASSMDVDRKGGGRIVNAEGLENAAAWGKPSPWVDYTGPVDGKTVGIAILNHPESFRHPTPWHVRTYGLFAANPFGLHDFDPKSGRRGDHVLPAGESLTFRHRIVLHTGDSAEGKVEQAFLAYAKPPEVKVESE